MKALKVLIVDDHPIIVEGYKNALLDIDSEKYRLEIDTATSCDSGKEMIEASIDSESPYQVVFLDVKLPPSSDGKILSGEDLGKLTKEVLPEAKIVILTMFNDNFRIHNILKNVNPDGFLIKSDITSGELVRAFNIVIKDPPYYSHTVTKLLRAHFTSDMMLDDIDRSILFHLSKGVKTKNLPAHIPLSLAAIEKRKRHLKEVFGVDKNNDEKLFEQASKKGYI